MRFSIPGRDLFPSPWIPAESSINSPPTLRHSYLKSVSLALIVTTLAIHERMPIAMACKFVIERRGMEEVFAVILAGGAGVRFWPFSREMWPKQMLDIVGEDSLLRQTIT